MVVHYFTFNKHSPSFRFRGLMILDYLQKIYNIEYIIYHPSNQSNLSMLKLIIKNIFLRNNHIYLFQKLSKPNVFIVLCAILAKFVKNKFYDIDDALYTVRKPTIINYFVKESTLVFVGSKNLKTHFIPFNENITILPTSVPPSYFIKKQGKSNKFIVGWIGTYFTHKENIKSFFTAIQNIKFDITIAILGVNTEREREEIRNLTKFNINITITFPIITNWNDNHSINEIIRTFNIGISPLIDSEMNISRSAFKLKQYFSCGIPVLSSFVGENVQYVINGFNGFLCQTSEEWIDKLKYFKYISTSEYETFQTNSYLTYLNSDFLLENVAQQFYQNVVNNIK